MKTANINFDDKTLDALDELAEKMGVSRSKACNLLLASVLGTAENGMMTALVTMASSVKKQHEKKRAEKASGELVAT